MKIWESKLKRLKDLGDDADPKEVIGLLVDLVWWAFQNLEAGAEAVTAIKERVVSEDTPRPSVMPQSDVDKEEKIIIGDLTMALVFRANGMTNLSDLQAVMNGVEFAIYSAIKNGPAIEAELPPYPIPSAPMPG